MLTCKWAFFFLFRYFFRRVGGVTQSPARPGRPERKALPSGSTLIGVGVDAGVGRELLQDQDQLRADDPEIVEPTAQRPPNDEDASPVQFTARVLCCSDMLP